MEKRIAVLYYEGRDLNTYPYVTNAVRLLTEKGYLVDIYLTSNMQSSFKISGVRLLTVSGLDPAKYTINSLKYIKKNKISYDFILSYSIEGLYVSYLLNKPSAYFSMELIYKNYLKKLENDLKASIKHFLRLKHIYWLLLPKKFFNKYKEIKNILLQIDLFKKIQDMKQLIKFSVIMDEKRGELLKEEFGFVDKILYVPNSYIGFSAEKSDFTYKKFNLPVNKKILLYAGGMEHTFFEEQFPSIINNLSSDYLIFLNVFSRDGFIKDIIEKYQKEIKENKIYVNTENLSEKEYDQLVKNSYIGIAWYTKSTEDNLYYLGYSSGKINKYLSCGLPAIAPAYYYKYKEFIDDNNIGRTCDDIYQIPDAVNYIENNYDFLCKNVESFYLKNLEYRSKFDQVLSEINVIISEED